MGMGLSGSKINYCGNGSKQYSFAQDSYKKCGAEIDDETYNCDFNKKSMEEFFDKI